MKKLNLLLLLLMVLHLSSLSAQNWLSEDATWISKTSAWGHFGSEIITLTQNDTVLAGQSCKILESKIQWENEASPIYNYYYMYESEEQLYYWVQDEFRLLYDFTMSVGDTMELFGDPLDSDFNCEESVFFVLDSLGLVSLNQTDKSVQYGKIYNPFSEELFTATIIETIGLVNLESEEYERSGYLIPSVIFPCAFDVTDFSFCSYQGTNISYNPTGQNCEVLPSATLEWLEIPIDIWPNPFNNILNVTYPKGMVPKRIRVVSTTGQLLEIINAPSTELTFKNNYQGMIILLMEFEEGLVLRKLIKRAGL